MAVTSLEELSKKFVLTEKELSWKESPISVPVLITDYYLSLIDSDNPNDPLRRQVFPLSSENTELEKESDDPLAEKEHSHGERLIHRYQSRVAFLTTDICAQYCRHCFRRRFTGSMMGPATEDDVNKACDYLKKHSEVKEMLMTGGDVLTLSDQMLDSYIEKFREASPKLIIRICTRVPVVNPDRITDDLVGIFKKHNTAPFYLLTQFNHPRELTEKSVKACAKFIDAGIPAMNQTVLLKGVNDDADTLEMLCNELLFARIKPYYLFQGDLVTGTSEFRVPIQKGMEIEQELRRRLSGLAMPNYTLDLPQGGGKIPLCGSYVISHSEGTWKFRTLYNEEREYPD